MLTPMDQGCGDDVFRKMERMKVTKSLGRTLIRNKSLDIEEHIAFENED